MHLGNLEIEIGKHAILQGHTESVTSVAVTADTRLIISGSADKTIRIWNLQSGECLRILEGHTDCVSDVSITPDGHFVVSASKDKTLRMWDLSEGSCYILNGHKFSVDSVAIDMNAQIAVSASFDGKLGICGIWDLKKHCASSRLDGHSGPVTHVTMTSDGQFAISTSIDQKLCIWGLGDLSRKGPLYSLQWHNGPVTSVAVTSDNRLVVSGSTDRTLLVWYLDWDIIPHDPADWDEGARPWLKFFLACHTPLVAIESNHSQCLVRDGVPLWTDANFNYLIQQLQWAGYGWLRPDGVRRELEVMAKEQNGNTSLIG
jgi:WD40 repeat protein